MAKIDFGEKLIANMQEHKITLILLLLWILLPYLLMGGDKMLWTHFPFWKILDLFQAWMSGHVWAASTSTSTWVWAWTTNIISLSDPTNIPGVVKSLLVFIFYLVALMLDWFLAMKMFKLIWPRTDENGQYTIEQ